MPYAVEPMQLDDIAEVAEIERQSYTTPWPVYAYRRELKDNRTSRYIVLRWVAPVNGVERGGGPPLTLPGSELAAPIPPSEAQGKGGSLLKRAVSRLFPSLLYSEQSMMSVQSRQKGPIVGYAGLWLVLDEGHVTTIAVRPDCRGQGLGEVLLVRLTEIAIEMGAKRMTLEVRVSNDVAQNLYRKYTYKIEGVRRRYYADNNEDAHIMWSDPIDSPAFQQRFAELRAALRQRLGERLAAGAI